ncbi:hypothetical protein GCM10023083_13120 [Streptomyces phyllanthi]
MQRLGGRQAEGPVTVGIATPPTKQVGDSAAGPVRNQGGLVLTVRGEALLTGQSVAPSCLRL